MDTLISKKTKGTLNKIVRESLAVALNSAEAKSPGMSAKTVASVSSKLVDQLMSDDRFMACLGTIAPPANEFLTTEDAARLSGFSRPFIISLLDGPLYTGTVTRSPKGHRRVLRGEFIAWLSAASLPTYSPDTIKDVRSGPRDEQPVTRKETATQKEERLAAKAKTMEFTRSKGVF